jgi:metal-responsive CopG/Arc/MetJ family transcriptional regulator
MSILSMRLDEELDRQLAMEAERARKSRSEVVREALAAYLREREQRRFQDEIVRAMRSLDPAEARALAEEALPLDNESLNLAEPVARYTVKRKPRTRKT